MQETKAHTCHAIGCTIAIPPRLFMDKKHWYAVPYPLRAKILREYREGQEITKDPSEKYTQAAAQAIIAVAEKEGKDIPGIYRTMAEEK